MLLCHAGRTGTSGQRWVAHCTLRFCATRAEPLGVCSRASLWEGFLPAAGRSEREAGAVMLISDSSGARVSKSKPGLVTHSLTFLIIPGTLTLMAEAGDDVPLGASRALVPPVPTLRAKGKCRC